MAANDEFPRGWQAFNGPGVGVSAIITIPALPNISHVLTSIMAQDIGAGAIGNAAIEVLSGATVLFTGQIGAQPAGGVGEFNWSGSLLIPINTVLTVEMSAVAGAFELLTVQGYDV